MADVFISYHEDSAGELAEQIADALAAAGISCWYAKRDMPIGGDFARNIPPQINACRLFLLLLNDGVYQSRHIENEVGLAFSRLNKGETIIILPLEIGDFIRKDWVAYYLIHTQSLKIALLDSVNQQELTRKIAESLGVTPQKPQPPEPTPEKAASKEPPKLTPSLPNVAQSPLLYQTEPLKLKKMAKADVAQPPPSNPTKPPRSNSWLAVMIRHKALVFLITSVLMTLCVFMSIFLYHPTWKLDGDTLIISGTGEMDYGLKFPRSVIGIPSNYPPWYRHSATVTKVIVKPGVANIEEYAFYDFSRLKSVEIPDSVIAIGNRAFGYCDRLKKIAISGSEADSRSLRDEFSDGLTTIGEFAFCNCINLTDFQIPNGVTEIGEHAFAGCTNLNNIFIPDSVTTIGNYAFSTCTSLKSVEIPDSVVKIGEYAFAGCTNLNNVFIPDSVTTIEKYAFIGCERLEKVSVLPRFLMGLTDVFPNHTNIDYRIKLH